MRILHIILLTFILVFVSCKSREDIAREQMVETLSIQMKDVQKLNTGTFSKLQQFEEKLNGLTGQVEETDHNTKVSINTKLKDLDARLTYLEAQNKSKSELIQSIHLSQEANQKYLKEVLSSLKKISTSNKRSSPYKMAMKFYKKRQYAKALPILIELFNSKKIKGNKKARVIHNLGMIAYNQKRYNDALVYHGKLISSYPKSWYTRNGYLYLGRSFHRLNKQVEAITTYKELIKKYPKTTQATKAKHYLQKLISTHEISQHSKTK